MFHKFRTVQDRIDWLVESNGGNCFIPASTAVLGGVLGASSLASAGASKGAANVQAQAAQESAQLQYSMYQQTAARLQPWVSTGTAATQQLGGLLGLSGYQASGAGGMGTGSLVQPFQPTMQQLQQTPGYQFTMQQGLEAVQNQATAMGQGGGFVPAAGRGGGTGAAAAMPSGAEGKGLINYAENLASTTYQQQFNNYWNQLSSIYNMVSGVSGQGASAAAGVGQAGQATAQGMSNALQTGAAATAAGITGATSSITSPASSIATIGLMNQIANQGNPLASGSADASSEFPGG